MQIRLSLFLIAALGLLGACTNSDVSDKFTEPINFFKDLQEDKADKNTLEDNGIAPWYMLFDSEGKMLPESLAFTYMDLNADGEKDMIVHNARQTADTGEDIYDIFLADHGGSTECTDYGKYANYYNYSAELFCDVDQKQYFIGFTGGGTGVSYFGFYKIEDTSLIFAEGGKSAMFEGAVTYKYMDIDGIYDEISEAEYNRLIAQYHKVKCE